MKQGLDLDVAPLNDSISQTPSALLVPYSPIQVMGFPLHFFLFLFDPEVFPCWTSESPPDLSTLQPCLKKLLVLTLNNKNHHTLRFYLLSGIKKYWITATVNLFFHVLSLFMQQPTLWVGSSNPDKQRTQEPSRNSSPGLWLRTCTKRNWKRHPNLCVVFTSDLFCKCITVGASI